MISLLAALDFGEGQAGNTALERGWHVPENGFVWSNGTQCSLLLPPPPAPDGVTLELHLAPYVRPPSLRRQRVMLAVNGNHVAQRALAFEETWRIEVPPHCLRGAKQLRISLHVPDAHSPAAVQAGADKRVLGLQLRRAVVLLEPERRDLPKPAGRLHSVAHAKFGCNETTEPMLLEGWGPPEPGHVWALGARSTLRLPLPPGGGGVFTLLLETRPFTDAQHLPRQRVAIGANTRLLHFVALTQHNVIALDLPETATADAAVDISFDNIDAAAHRDFGLHADGRPFAFMLHSIRLLRAAARAPEHSGETLPRLECSAIADLAAIVSRFVSLGNACDLGFLQRDQGHEPASLLRFAAIPAPALVAGLQSCFAGLGRTDTLIMRRRFDFDCGCEVIDIIDDNWGIGFHINGTAGKDTEIKRQVSRILPFLIRIFFAEAVAADKVFVFQRRDCTTRLEAEALLASLATWGDATLLWATYDPVQQPGSVTRLGPRLLCGYVDQPNSAAPASDDCWLSLLANAWEMQGKNVLFEK